MTGQQRRRDARIARPSLPGGEEPARFHRGRSTSAPRAGHGNAGGRHEETIASRRRRCGASGPAPCPDPVDDARRRAGRRRRFGSRPGSRHRREVRDGGHGRSTGSSWDSWMPSRSPCRRSCTARSPRRSCPRASPRWSRSRWPARSPRPSSSRRWPATMVPSSRWATSNASTRPCWPSIDCRSGPSTSRPSGSRPTRSGRPTSASSST